MKVLGIDPGYGLCGFAVLEQSSQKDLTLHTSGVIRTKPRTHFPDRLQEIAEDFDALLKQHRPDLVAIEDLFFVQNVTTGMQVSQVRGVLLYLAHKQGVALAEPKPVEIKQTFTGDGKATKSAMKKMAKMLFGSALTPKVDDAIDAIAVAYWALQKPFDEACSIL